MLQRTGPPSCSTSSLPAPIFCSSILAFPARACVTRWCYASAKVLIARSEEHTSELQSQSNLVCRLLLEKKKTRNATYYCATTFPRSGHSLLLLRYL